MVWADTEAVGCGFLTTKGITFEDDKEKMAWLGAKDWVESVRVIFSTSKSKKKISGPDILIPKLNIFLYLRC